MAAALFMLLGAVCAMVGVVLFLATEKKILGIYLFPTGAMMLLFSVSITGSSREMIGYCLFCGSYYFLAPALKAYIAYEESKKEAYWAEECCREQIMEKGRKAKQRGLFWVALFVLGLITGLGLICSALAV